MKGNKLFQIFCQQLVLNKQPHKQRILYQIYLVVTNTANYTVRSERNLCLIPIVCLSVVSGVVVALPLYPDEGHYLWSQGILKCCGIFNALLSTPILGQLFLESFFLPIFPVGDVGILLIKIKES